MSLNVILLHPEEPSKVYQSLAPSRSAVETPIWSLMLAGALRRQHKEVAIVDMAAEGLSVEGAAERINDLRPHLTVAVVYSKQPSGSTHNMTTAIDVLKQVGGETMMVGGHPAALRDQTLKESGCDYVSNSEGLRLIREVLGGGFNGNDLLDPMTDLIDLPWDLLPMEKYRAYNWMSWGFASRQPYAALYSSLGCPHACHFCAVQSPFYAGQHAQGMKGNSYRMWSPQWVGEQLEHVVKTYGVKHVRIADEMFLLNVAHVEGICDEIIQRGLDLNLYVYARADTCGNQALLSKMKKAGFNWVCIGYESASAGVRQSVGKRYSNEVALQSRKNLKEAGIYLLANHIVGIHSETLEDMRATVAEAMEMMPEFWNVYCSTPYPGSALYREAVEKGWPLPKTWADYAQHSKNFTPHGTETMTPAEVVQFRDEAFQKFMQNPSYQSHVEKIFGVAARQDVEAMSRSRLERYVPAR